jgi:hypothetical protein
VSIFHTGNDHPAQPAALASQSRPSVAARLAA